MLIGDKSRFAIETTIHSDAERTIQRVYGRFRLWISGVAFGLDEDDATCLACVFNELKRRLVSRGSHHDAEFAQFETIDALNWVTYAAYESMEPNQVEGRQRADRLRQVWLHDGDEAFDDGSVVIHLDMGEMVRLIAGRRVDGYVSDAHNPPEYTRWAAEVQWDRASLVDVCIESDALYTTISQWIVWMKGQVDCDEQ